MEKRCLKIFAIALLSFTAIMFFAGCDNTFERGTDQQRMENNRAILAAQSPGIGSYSGDIGNFWTFWKSDEVGSSATMNLNAANDSYTTSCSNMKGGFVAGIGWTNTNNNANRVIHFTGSYHSNYGGAFGVYGWTSDPYVEYYICEKVGDVQGPHNSSENKSGDKSYTNADILGSYYSDGGMYRIYSHYRDGFPWIGGSGDGQFWQFISVRISPRTSGTITMANHIQAWANTRRRLSDGSRGDYMTLGNFTGDDYHYQILFTEMWGAQDNDGKALNSPKCSGTSSGKFMKYHSRPLRLKTYSGSTRYLAVNSSGNCYASSNGSTSASKWYLCVKNNADIYRTNEYVLMSDYNGKYIRIYNNHAFASVTNIKYATKFYQHSMKDGSGEFRYGNTNNYLSYDGDIVGSNDSSRLFRIIYYDNVD